MASALPPSSSGTDYWTTCRNEGDSLAAYAGEEQGAGTEAYAGEEHKQSFEAMINNLYL